MSVMVAVDDGYAQTKVLGGQPTRLMRTMVPSSIRPGRFGVSSMSGAGNMAAYQVEEGEEFTVSSAIVSESTAFDSYHLSTMNRVLVTHALMEAGFGGQEIDLVVGLPVSQFFVDGHKDEERVARKIGNLRRKVTSLDGRPGPRLRDVQVGCQAIAAFVDWMLDDDLDERHEGAERVAVVDIGGFTMDVAVILGGEQVDQRRTGSSRIGLLDVHDTIAAGIRTRFGIQDRFPIEVMDAALRTRSIRLWGRIERLENTVDHALSQFRNRVAREMERKLGGAADLDAILFVGGGAALLGDMRDVYPNAVMIEDPEFANARGLWKFARLRQTDRAS